MHKVDFDSTHCFTSYQTISVEIVRPYTRRIPIQLIGKADSEPSHNDVIIVTNTRSFFHICIYLDGCRFTGTRRYRKEDCEKQQEKG